MSRFMIKGCFPDVLKKFRFSGVSINILSDNLIYMKNCSQFAPMLD